MKNFKLIDIKKWDRKELYLHYTKNVPCSYSLSVELDITPLKNLYASMIWLLSDSVNEFKEFRTCLVDGKLGVFDSMNPSYMILRWVSIL